MTQVSEIIVNWTPPESGRVHSVQIQSRIVGTEQWQEQASSFEEEAGAYIFQSNAPASDIEVRMRNRMANGIYGDWATATIRSAGQAIFYDKLTGLPVKLGDISPSEGTKLEGIAPNATVGAPNGTNVGGVPAEQVIVRITDARKVADDAKTAIGLVEQNVVGVQTTINTEVTRLSGKIDAETARVLAAANLAVSNSDAAQKLEFDDVKRQISEVVVGNGEAGTAVRDVITAYKAADTVLSNRITTLDANSSSSAGNLLPNSTLATLDGWGYGASNPAGGLFVPDRGLDLAGDDYRPRGEHTIGMRQLIRVGDSSYMDWSSEVIPVRAGDYMQVYAFCMAHRSAVQVIFEYYNVAGQSLGAPASGIENLPQVTGLDPNNWRQLGVASFLVPATAICGRVILRKFDTQTGGDSYAWFWRPYIGLAKKDQTAWNAYAPGSGSAIQTATRARIEDVRTVLAQADQAIINTATINQAEYKELNRLSNVRITDEIKGISDANGALGLRASVLEVQVSGDSNNLVKNGTFNQISASWFPDSNTRYPPQWSGWNRDGNGYIGPAGFPSKYGAQWPLQIDRNGTSNGIMQYLGPQPAGWYVIEADVDFQDGAHGGAGVHVNFLGQAICNIDFGSSPDTNADVIAGVRNGNRKFSLLFYIGGAVNEAIVYLMAGWSGFGSPNGFLRTIWHKVVVRPASEGEVKAKKADATLNTPGTGLVAKVANHENAIVNLPNNYASASRASALEAASLVGSSVARNDRFAMWPDAAGYPSGWRTWAAEGNYRIERVPGRAGSPYAIRTLNDAGDNSSGFCQDIYLTLGKWIFEVTAESDASGFRGAGVTIGGQYSLDFLAKPDINGVVGDSANSIRSWTLMFEVTDPASVRVITLHAMHSWPGFGRGSQPKYMKWHRVSVRPATDGEILAGKAYGAIYAPGGLSAKISNLETVTSNGTFAAATTTNTLSAQMSRTEPSALNNHIDAVNGRIDTVAANTVATLNANIENRASAIADQKAGAVASTVQTLRSEYDQTKATVTNTAGTIVDLQNRSRAYWQVTADAGNGRAQITVAADGYGPVVDIVGNVRIGGNLVVDGTVTSGKLAPSSVQQVAFITLGYDIAVPRGGYGGGGGYEGGGGGGGGGGTVLQ